MSVLGRRLEISSHRLEPHSTSYFEDQAEESPGNRLL